MSEASPHKSPSHAAAWSAAAIGLLLLYFLSVPWVTVLASRHGIFNNVGVEVYAAPWYFIYFHTPLETPMRKYDEWCFAF